MAGSFAVFFSRSAPRGTVTALARGRSSKGLEAVSRQYYRGTEVPEPLVTYTSAIYVIPDITCMYTSRRIINGMHVPSGCKEAVTWGNTVDRQDSPHLYLSTLIPSVSPLLWGKRKDTKGTKTDTMADNKNASVQRGQWVYWLRNLPA